MYPYRRLIKPHLGSRINKGHPLAKGLVGCWLMNDNPPLLGKTFDSSGHGNTGTLVGNTHVVPGKFGSCLSFDVDGDCVNFGDVSIFDNLTALTVSVWVQSPTATPDVTNCILRKGGSGNDPIEISWAVTQNVSFILRDEANAATSLIWTDGIVNTNWHHIVGMYANGIMYLFIDGIAWTSTSAFTGPIGTSSANFYLGQPDTTTWNGLINNLQIYNRVLSASEIAQLYREPFCMFKRPFIELFSAAAAGGALTANVYDNIGMSDAVEVSIAVLEISVADSIGLTDVIEAKVPVLEVSVYDSVGLADVTTTQITAYEISVYDNVGLADETSAIIPVLEVNACDSIVLTDVTTTTIPSGNDFSADAYCKALWRLESGALTADSKGGNTLTNTGVDEDTVNFKEGACSGLFVREENDRMTIADADTDAGFPLRSDAANTTFSFAVWIKLTAIDFTQYILDKTGGVGVRQMIIYVNAVNKVILSISVDGDTWLQYTHDSALAANIWYHVAVTHNDADHAYRIRIWDDTAGAILGVDKTGTTVHPYLSNAEFYLGYTTSATTLGGNLDEVVAFNDVLTVDEIDAIRAETYSGGTRLVSVYDNIGVSDETYLLIPILLASVYDAVGLGDEANLEIPILEIFVFDSIGITEDVSALLNLYEVLVSENLALTEDVSVSIPILEVNIYDLVGLTDVIEAQVPAFIISVYDTIGLEDSVTCVRQPDWQPPSDSSDAAWSVVDEVSSAVWSNI